MKMGVVQVTTLLILLLAINCDGVFRFANYYQDHMTLQRAPQKAVVWGYSDASTLTTLRLGDKIYTTVSSARVNEVGDAIWSVTLDPVSDEGPYDVNVNQKLPNGTVLTITLHDVLFGDVWICSGQSNMQFTVDMMFNGTEEIANAGNFPKIRLFTVSLIPSAVPIEELLGINLNWSVASPQTVGGPAWNYMSATCWCFGRMVHQALNGRPLGLIATSWGGTPVEFWEPPEALHECNATSSEYVPTQAYNAPAVTVPVNNSDLYNAMIYPFTRMVIYGAIWYQGEANAGNPSYACKFAKMIEYWRKVWNQRTNGITDPQFPFGFVQLSTWTNDTSHIGGFPMLRWQQTFNVGYVPNNVVPKVFMAVALDLRDDPNGIHPRTKLDVGYRLSRSGLAVAYGQQVEYSGPIVENVVYSSGASSVAITYGSVSSIDVRNNNGFEMCCDAAQCQDQLLWTATPISDKSGLTLTLRVPNDCVGKQLVGLRYLWRETPCEFKQAAIYSGTDSNLPSPPYIKMF